MVEFEGQRGVYSGYGRGAGCGHGRRAWGERSHLNSQVLCADQAVPAEVVICLSVHHQEPGAVGHLTDPLHHLQTEEMSL